MISFSAQGDEGTILNQGDVQREFLRAKGFQIPEANQQPVSKEQNCRRLALAIFDYRHRLHNKQDRVDLKELVDQSAQLGVTTQIYFHLGCNAERLMTQDVYVKAKNKNYYVGSERK